MHSFRESLGASAIPTIGLVHISRFTSITRFAYADCSGAAEAGVFFGMSPHR
eukprot:m.935953 g.935953  ORF g.935953 m.935953 type:complete len:52 (-) comp216198_c0_seq1:400-555(-)